MTRKAECTKIGVYSALLRENIEPRIYTIDFR